MVKGRYDPKASTATSYAWLVWRPGAAAERTIFEWIPSCCAKLMRPGDYSNGQAEKDRQDRGPISLFAELAIIKWRLRDHGSRTSVDGASMALLAPSMTTKELGGAFVRP